MQIVRRGFGVLAALMAMGLALAPTAAAAEGDDTTGNEALVGAGAAVATLVYGPAKLAYAAGGGLVSGLAWVWSGGDDEVVRPILNSSLRGDYVVTPAHLRGERQIEFIGRTPAQRAAQREIESRGVSGAPPDGSRHRERPTPDDSLYGETF